MEEGHGLEENDKQRYDTGKAHAKKFEQGVRVVSGEAKCAGNVQINDFETKETETKRLKTKTKRRKNGSFMLPPE